MSEEGDQFWNILRVRQAAAQEDRIAFKLSGRLATSAPVPTLRVHARTHAHLHAAESAVRARAARTRRIWSLWKESNQKQRHEENTTTFHYFRHEIVTKRRGHFAQQSSFALRRFRLLFSTPTPFSSTHCQYVFLADRPRAADTSQRSGYLFSGSHHSFIAVIYVWPTLSKLSKCLYVRQAQERIT